MHLQTHPYKLTAEINALGVINMTLLTLINNV